MSYKLELIFMTVSCFIGLAFSNYARADILNRSGKPVPGVYEVSAGQPPYENWRIVRSPLRLEILTQTTFRIRLLEIHMGQDVDVFLAGRIFKNGAKTGNTSRFNLVIDRGWLVRNRIWTSSQKSVPSEISVAPQDLIKTVQLVLDVQKSNFKLTEKSQLVIIPTDLSSPMAKFMSGEFKLLKSKKISDDWYSDFNSIEDVACISKLQF